MMLKLLALTTAMGATTAARVAAPLKTFGTGASAFKNAGPERAVFNHTLSPGAETGAMTHFWTTGDTDAALWSYYVDGEKTASVAFNAPQVRWLRYRARAASPVLQLTCCAAPTGGGHFLRRRGALGQLQDR